MTTSECDALRSILNDEAKPLRDRVLAADALRFSLVRDNGVPIRRNSNVLSDGELVAQRVIDLGTRYLVEHFDNDVYDALERAYITRAPNDLHSYLIALEWNRDAKSRFYQPRMATLREFVDAITDMMVHDLYDILMMSSPPRGGKTTTGLLAVSWVAGRDPNSPILMTGYAEKITKMFYNGLSETYEDSQYNYRQIFPHLELVNTSANDLTLDFRDDGKKATRKYKTVTCRAIDGSLTGATEARQLLYCDDLVRDIEEAMNPSRLEALRDKMVTNVYSRKKEGCKELHIGTRWSVHDPLGWVERKHEDNPRCKVIRIPALDEETNKSNFDYPYGVGFSTAYYQELRRLEDDVTWECVYQQNPIERAGLLFPAGQLNYCYEIPDFDHNPPDDIFAFCDVAFGGGDYLSMPIAIQYGEDDPIVIDAVFLKGDYKISEPIVSGTLVKYRVGRAVFEANNGGDFYARDVIDLLAKTHHKCHITASRAPSNKSKESRIIQHSPAIKAFTFLHPSAGSNDYRQFMQGLTTYTMSGKNPNDDAPDSLAGLAAMMRTNLNASIKIFDRRHI